MDFSKISKLVIPEGTVQYIADASGKVIWSSRALQTHDGELITTDQGEQITYSED